ncbi:MAG: hypothetical protein HC837_14210 [Chloroflexaceae bacterium]|nr:hypothetical protein [Chloroflexaceae bacterium]
MWRHGDVLIAPVSAIPEAAVKRKSAILAYGEVTGHSHRIAEPHAAECWDHEGIIYMRIVTDTATVVHEEHQPITLPRGIYRVWQQREYTPQEIRRVVD